MQLKIKINKALSLLFSIFFICSLVLSAHSAFAAPIAEYKVKAAFFLKFADFIDWPIRLLGNASSPIRVGVVGHDPFKALLPEKISQADENGSFYFKVSRISPKTETITNYDMLFFSSKSLKDYIAMKDKIKKLPILTVGDGRKFLEKGGMLAFSLENNMVRFSANLRSFKRANMSIRAQLLELAKRVLR